MDDRNVSSVNRNLCEERNRLTQGNTTYFNIYYAVMSAFFLSVVPFQNWSKDLGGRRDVHNKRFFDTSDRESCKLEDLMRVPYTKTPRRAKMARVSKIAKFRAYAAMVPRGNRDIWLLACRILYRLSPTMRDTH